MVNIYSKSIAYQILQAHMIDEVITKFHLIPTQDMQSEHSWAIMARDLKRVVTTGYSPVFMQTVRKSQLSVNNLSSEIHGKLN